MNKPKQSPTNPSALDIDVIETFAAAHEPASVPAELKARMKTTVMKKIAQEKTCEGEGFSTQRGSDDDWVEAMPGGKYKILHDDGNGLDGVMSYLIKLEAGVKMGGHNHPFDEECLVLEGDLTFGELTLNAGDFHFAQAGVRHHSVSTKNGCIAFIRGALPV